MSSSSSTETASALLLQTNELLENLARLNSNVELYTQVHSLQQNLNALEENYNSLQNNIKTSICNTQCKDLNTRRDPNSVDDFLVQLLLSKSNPPPPAVPQEDVILPAPDINDYQSSLLKEASAPP